MNIENFEPLKGLTLDDVFKKQMELEFLYEPEVKPIFEHFDIDCLEDQEFFKTYCWRVTEELCEALEALDNNEEKHITEEIMDGFNFMIEMIGLYGWSLKDLDITSIPPQYDLRRNILDIIEEVGLTANCLKNRKWRQSQYLVDLYVFERRLRKAFNLYLNLLREYMTDEELIETWSLKYQVNMFRIETKY